MSTIQTTAFAAASMSTRVEMSVKPAAGEVTG